MMSKKQKKQTEKTLIMNAFSIFGDICLLIVIRTYLPIQKCWKI